MMNRLLLSTFVLAFSFEWRDTLARNIRGAVENSSLEASARREALRCSSEGYFSLEIVVKNMLTDNECVKSLKSGAIASAIEDVLVKLGPEMENVMAPVNSLSTTLCSEFRPLETGWTWRGTGKVDYCDRPMGLLEEQGGNVISISQGEGNSFETYERTMWKYHSLLKKKLTTSMKKWDVCFDEQPEIESIVTPLGGSVANKNCWDNP